MPLLAALDQEKDREVRSELLLALACIDAPEARSALVRLATERRNLLGRGGRPTSERLEVVSVLANAGTENARQALSRIASESEGAVRDAATEALGPTDY